MERRREMTHRTRRDFLKTAGVGFGAAGLAASGCTQAGPGPAPQRPPTAGRSPRRPNILFICTDYQSGVDGPSLGSPFLDMPALDRLCREGAVFTQHYSTAPICVPARYTWITGRYPHYHGAWDNHGKWVPEGSPILMAQLKRHGYHTVGVGKMHFRPVKRMAGFDRRIIADMKEAGWNNDDFAKFLKAHGKDVNRIYKKQGPEEIPRVYDYPEPEELHIDHFVGTQAAGVIERGELKGPWFLWVSFNGPHSPWDPPAKYSEPYKKMKLPKAVGYEGELKTKPSNHTDSRYIYTRSIVDLIDRQPHRREEILHAIRAAHYGNLTLIDRRVEGILKALEDRGELDSTVIIYSADHGALLGDHNLLHKDLHYERAARVPFVVRCPGLVRPRRLTGLSGHVDLMPTMLSLAGAPIPESLEGKDLTPMLTGQADSVQDAVFIEIRNDTSIVTEKWKMGINPADGLGDLYDRHADPDDLHNLYNDPRYAETREELTARLIKFNPDLARQIAAGPTKRFTERPVHHFVAGEERAFRKETPAPYQAGKAITIEADVEQAGDTPIDGVLITTVALSHGYSLYVRQGRLEMAVWRWGKQTLVTSPAPLPTGRLKVQALWAKDGAVTLAVNGREVASGKAAGCIPVQPGRPTARIAGYVCVGKAKAWGKPTGGFEKRAPLVGTLHGVTLRLD